MTARTLYSWTGSPARRVLPALVLVLATGFSSAQASAVAPAHAFGSKEHAHNCKCATRCQGPSCCCGPREAQTAQSYRESDPGAARIGASPCTMTSAPCGNSGLPGTPSEGPVTRIAALAVLEYRRLDAVGTLLPFCTWGLTPVRRASRLDRPPELLILA